MIFAIAAVSLDLILGYGGMVSFGHAAYLGHRRLRGRHPGVPRHPATAWCSGRWRSRPRRWWRSLIGAVSLRTSGVSFIMITLAFAQMLYYLGICINACGGDDGMRLARRSEFGGVLDLANPLRLLLRRAGDLLSRCCGSVTGWSMRASAW